MILIRKNAFTNCVCNVREFYSGFDVSKLISVGTYPSQKFERNIISSPISIQFIAENVKEVVLSKRCD